MPLSIMGDNLAAYHQVGPPISDKDFRFKSGLEIIPSFFSPALLH
jgi:hypothetical protein